MIGYGDGGMVALYAGALDARPSPPTPRRRAASVRPPAPPTPSPVAAAPWPRTPRRCPRGRGSRRTAASPAGRARPPAGPSPGTPSASAAGWPASPAGRRRASPARRPPPPAHGSCSIGQRRDVDDPARDEQRRIGRLPRADQHDRPLASGPPPGGADTARPCADRSRPRRRPAGRSSPSAAGHLARPPSRRPRSPDRRRASAGATRGPAREGAIAASR